MPTNPGLLAQKIQRLMLSDADKARLLEELKSLDEAKMQQLSELIHEHDEEAMVILDQKASEQQAVKEKIMAASPLPRSEAVNEEEGVKYIKFLEEIFKSPQDLAQFVMISDDYFLQQLETVLVNSLKGNEKYQEEFRHFFREVRLQKAALAKQDAEAEKKALIEAIEKTQEQSKQIDQIIAKAEKALNHGK